MTRRLKEHLLNIRPFTTVKSCPSLSVVVAQLVERSVQIPEVCGSNPVIGKINIEHLFTVNCIEKTEIKKRPGKRLPYNNYL